MTFKTYVKYSSDSAAWAIDGSEIIIYEKNREKIREKNREYTKNLTEEQRAKFPEYVKKWTDIGLCTKRADRKKAEQACKEAYKVAGLEDPKVIIWAESPIGLLLTAKLIKEISKNVPGIIDTEKCLVRKTGMVYFVDLHIIVNGDLSVREGHTLAHQLKNVLMDELPQVADILMHVEPDK